MTSLPASGLQLRSLVTGAGTLDLSLVDVPIPTPADDEVVIRVDAAPINPSDLGLLIGGADLTQATSTGSGAGVTVSAPIAPNVLRGLKGRLDESMAVGNEGAGVVVAAGSSEAAQALLGKTVALAGGAMYSQYRCAKAAICSPLSRRHHR
jgi:NADPH:quinone reductase